MRATVASRLAVFLTVRFRDTGKRHPGFERQSQTTLSAAAVAT